MQIRHYLVCISNTHGWRLEGLVDLKKSDFRQTKIKVSGFMFELKNNYPHIVKDICVNQLINLIFFSVQEIILHAKSLNRFNFQHIKKIWNTFVVLGLVWSDQDERIDGHWHWMEMYLDILNKLLHEQQLSYLYHILTSAGKSTTGHKLACEFLVDISIHQFVEESLYSLAKVFSFFLIVN